MNGDGFCFDRCGRCRHVHRDVTARYVCSQPDCDCRDHFDLTNIQQAGTVS